MGAADSPLDAALRRADLADAQVEDLKAQVKDLEAQLTKGRALELERLKLEMQFKLE